jgi:hypothetical protein
MDLTTRHELIKSSFFYFIYILLLLFGVSGVFLRSESVDVYLLRTNFLLLNGVFDSIRLGYVGGVCSSD